MQITAEIEDLAKKQHFTAVELFELAHACEITHPENAQAVLIEHIKKGRNAGPFGRRFHEIHAARQRLMKIIEAIGGRDGELKVLHGLIAELEPKAVEADQKRQAARREESKRAREGA